MTKTKKVQQPLAPIAEAKEKPKLRGVIHQWSFFVFLVGGVILQLPAKGTTSHVVAAIYSVSICLMLGVSALFHRVTWTPERRLIVRRLDHSMIFLAVAGTYTPVAVLALSPFARNIVLTLVWVGAIGGIVTKMIWIGLPKPVSALIYVVLGWTAVGVMPQLYSHSGVLAFSLLVTGGILYTLGAVVYAFKKPDPWPKTFGYHEIFHSFVTLAAVSHFLVVLLLITK
ncbi:MAG: hemolysin III family protein [Actinomycetota bacterium]|nr:hemolysin III family protein [Actinomycetota bacterium]